MSDLAQQECITCKGGVPPLKGEPLRNLQQQLGAGWNVVQEHHLEKEYTFKNFRDALAFTNRVGELAEATNHHPDIYLAWGKVRITIRAEWPGNLFEVAIPQARYSRRFHPYKAPIVWRAVRNGHRRGRALPHERERVRPD